MVTERPNQDSLTLDYELWNCFSPNYFSLAPHRLV